MPLDIIATDMIMFGLLLVSLLNWKIPFHCLVCPRIEICEHCLGGVANMAFIIKQFHQNLDRMAVF